MEATPPTKGAAMWRPEYSPEAGHDPTTRTKEAQNNGQTRTMQEAAHQKVAQAKAGDTNTARSRRHTSSTQKTQNN